MDDFSVSRYGGQMKFEILNSTVASRESLDEAATDIFNLFLQREAEFGVHPSVVIHYPDVSDLSTDSFLTDAASYVDRLTHAMIDDCAPAGRRVVLTTYGNLVAPSFKAAGYNVIPIDMPAGPEHTCAFVLGQDTPPTGQRTLYVEAVNEADEKIRPTFVIRFVDEQSNLCAGACGSIHERDGRRYAYLATMTVAPHMEKGTGTKLTGELIRFLREQGVHTVHLGTQTASTFYQQMGFKINHRLVQGMRTHMVNGHEISEDLVMLSREL